MIRRVFPVLAISIFCCMLGSGIVVPLLPLYAESLGASGLWLGMVFAAYPVARIIMTPVIGRISDQRGRKVFITTGLFAYGVISFGFIWSDTIFLLVLLRFLHGIAGAFILPVAQAYVGDLSPEGEEGKWMSYANAAFFSGFGFGPLMGGVLAEHLGMNFAFISMGGLSLIAFFIAVPLLHEVRKKQSTVSHYPSLKDIGRSGMSRGLFVFRLSLTMGRATFFTFLPILAAQNLNLRPSLVGALLSIHVLLMSILGIPAGRIADRLNRRFLVILGCLISFAFLVAVPHGYTFSLMLVLIALGSLGNAVAVASGSALAVEEGRKYGMGSSIALFSMAMSIGMVAGPITGGAITDVFGIDTAFYFGALVTILGAGLFGRLSKGE